MAVQESLIYLLLLFVLLALQACYFGFVRPSRPLAWLQQWALLVCLVILIPATLYTLYSQSGAKQRLQDAGLALHPSIGSSVGLATGGVGQGNWVFELHAPISELRAFYRRRDNLGSWRLVDETPVMMLLQREGERLTIGYREGRGDSTVMFLLSPP